MTWHFLAGPTVGPEGPHRCSRRLQPSAGATKMPPVAGGILSSDIIIIQGHMVNGFGSAQGGDLNKGAG